MTDVVAGCIGVTEGVRAGKALCIGTRTSSYFDISFIKWNERPFLGCSNPVPIGPGGTAFC